jgi:nitrite reductase/ring-hydroxylating ferredoxin subunit
VPVGRYLTSEQASQQARQKIANINELPPNSRKIFTYPVTGIRSKDSDPFRKFVLIRLPNGELKAWSMVCLHLWCLVDYKPKREQIECPCHGSIYDPKTGVGVAGPVAVQQNKTLPEVKLEVDENGDIYATGVIGVVGYGQEAVR